MRGLRSLNLLLAVGFLLLAGSGLWYAISGNPDEEGKLEIVGAHIQEDFLEQARKARELLSLPPSEADQGSFVRLNMDERCRLDNWNSVERLPGMRIMPDLCSLPSDRTLSDNNKVYYFLREDRGEGTNIVLMPLWVTYKVANSNLPPYIFLGRYSTDPYVADRVREFDLQFKQRPGAISIFDEDGDFVFSLKVPDAEVFFYTGRQRMILLVFLGMVLMLFGLWKARSRLWPVALTGAVIWAATVLLAPGGLTAGVGPSYWAYLRLALAIVLALGAIAILFFPSRLPARFRTQTPGWLSALLFALLLVGLRLLLLHTGFPYVYVPMRLFSPTLLAIDNLSPSLGDLMLNTLTVFLVVWLFIRELSEPMRELYQRVVTKPAAAWPAHIMAALLAVWMVGAYVHLIDRAVQHSTLSFDFANIFRLDFYSFFAFAVIGAAFAPVALMLLQVFRFSYLFVRKEGRFQWIALTGFLTTVVLGAWLLLGLNAGSVLSILVSFIFLLLIVYRSEGRKLQVDLLNFLLLTGIFSVATTLGLSQGQRHRMQTEMEMVANRQSDEHDLVTESVFQRVKEEVQDEMFTLQYSVGPNISKTLKENFFESNFKGYDVRIFVYDQKWDPIDKSTQEESYLPPDSSLSLSQVGSPTMTPGLYLMPYYRGIFESIYIGQFELFFRDRGTIIVRVELFPTEIQPNRLYPQLLLDDMVRSKAMAAKDYAYAVYRGGNLFRKHSTESFPQIYSGPGALDSLNFVFESQEEYFNLYYKVSEEKIVQVRTEAPHLMDTANLFSFVFYLYVLMFLLLMLPAWTAAVIRNPRRLLRFSLRGRIQSLFLFISVFPLVAVLFFMSPYIKDKIYNDIKLEVQAETARVAALLREEYLALRRGGVGYPAMLRAMNDRLSAIEKTLFNDINIYYNNGRMHLSTQPSIYKLGLMGEYMNPEVYKAIRSGNVSDMVVEDRVGKISFFSGYYPLRADNGKIIGFLNIPYLKNSDLVNEQSMSLLTFLVNIYVFLFFVIGILAVILSNSILRPLTLLSRKLQATTLGATNEPIEWKGEDELGEIIRSYNDMLEKLAESEEKLARSERESAWKEMARQVAHEIKNPLTPMKLSLQHLIRSYREQKENLPTLFDKVTNTILVQIDSLVNIANSFSEFSRMPEPNRSTFKLQEVLQEVADLYQVGGEVQFDLDLPEEDFYVHSDRDQLSRVFNNLVKNGIQAVEQGEPSIGLKMNVTDGMAKVTVTDNGKGVPEEIKKKIFQPNFSTKTSGMGLGLAIVKKIIEGAGGQIYFESETGKGTTFFVELPGVDPQA